MEHRDRPFGASLLTIESVAVIGGIIIAGILIARALRRRAHERAWHRQRPPGREGIIPGAEPLALDAVSARAGVLLVHGFGDTPQTLGLLAEALHRRGFSVRSPLLPGHGRSLAAFRRSRADEWERAVLEAYTELRSLHERTAVVGLSMGGALSVLLAARHEVRALVLIAPYFLPPRRVRAVARIRHVWDFVMPYTVSRSEASIHDPEARAASLGYGVVTARLLAALVEVAERAWASLPLMRAPLLIVQSRGDNRTTSAIAESVAKRAGSEVKRLLLTEEGGHVITVDIGRERVISEVAEWIEKHTVS